jgi:hypothetical protein
MQRLVKLTSDCVGDIINVGEDQGDQTAEISANNASQAVQLSWDVAQRANVELNIDASIRFVSV